MYERIDKEGEMGSVNYLFILDDGDIKQRDKIEEGDPDSVVAGMLDVVRFHNGRFERLEPTVGDDGRADKLHWEVVGS